jgi:anti-sigma factor RsiW
VFWNRTAHPKDEDLSAYLDGELRGAALAAMNTHVDGCERCRSLLDDLSTAKAALASLPHETPRRSFQIAPRLKPARRSLIPAWTPAVALTVFLVLVAVDVGPFGGSSHDSATSGGALTAQSANDSAGKSAEAPEAAPRDTFSSTPVSGPAAAAASSATAPSAEAQRQASTAPPVATTQQGAASAQADQGSSGGNLGTLRLDDKDNGRSLTTLNLLEGVFLALFLGSMLGLYVWPRLLRKGP